MDADVPTTKRVKFDHTAPDPSITSSLEPMDFTSTTSASSTNSITASSDTSPPTTSSASITSTSATTPNSNGTSNILPPPSSTLDEPFNTPRTNSHHQTNGTTPFSTATTATTTTTALIDEPTNMPPPVTKIEDQPALLIKKLSDKAKLPTRGSAFAAGYDVYAAKETVVLAKGKALVDTDIAIAVPAGTYGRIAPRSGLASKHFIDTGAGVIDADYRGQVKILLFNHSDVDFPVKEGDRVAQLVLERIYTPEVVEVQELEESVRGAGGFGSTGS